MEIEHLSHGWPITFCWLVVVAIGMLTLWAVTGVRA